MSRIRLYMDEDAMEKRLLHALRSHEFDVISASQAAMVDREDDEHLMTATGVGRVLFSYNACDYHRLIVNGSPPGASTPA
jgi:hypothetical protein